MSMNSSAYLKQYGWKEGQPLRKGGISKPILVKHKNDKKGIGHQPLGHGADNWWERLFDGQLKGLDVNTTDSGEVSFKQERVVASAVAKSESPLYRMFVKGETLQGSVGVTTMTAISSSTTVKFNTDDVKTGFKKSSKKSDKKSKEKKDKTKKSKLEESEEKTKTKKSKDEKEKGDKTKKTKLEDPEEKSKTKKSKEKKEKTEKKEKKEKKEKTEKTEKTEKKKDKTKKRKLEDSEEKPKAKKSKK